MIKYHYHCDCSTGCHSLSTLPHVDVAKSSVSQLRKQTLGAEVTCARHSTSAVSCCSWDVEAGTLYWFPEATMTNYHKTW